MCLRAKSRQIGVRFAKRTCHNFTPGFYRRLRRCPVSTAKRIFIAFLMLLALGGGVTGYLYWRMGKAESWESSVRQFEEADRLHPPGPGVIVFTGSSSIRLWDTLADDMKPLNVVNRGFGGSQIADVNHFANRIVIPYRPRAVVLYAGENDLSAPWSKSPETVFADFRKFVQIVHSQLPETWIYYVSMKPSPLREAVGRCFKGPTK